MDVNMTKYLQLFLLLIILSSNCSAIEIYGHRGAAGLAPENTLIAYQRAIDHGVDVIDMDVGLTKDGIVVVHHDLSLNPEITRMANGAWLTRQDIAIKDLKLSKLKTYNVGKINPKSDYYSIFPYQTPEQHAQIPTLQEVIRYAKARNPEIKFQIEIKTDPRAPDVSPQPSQIVPAIIKVLRQEKVANITEVHSFDWRNLYLLEKQAPEISRSYITEQKIHGNQDTTWTAGPLLGNEHKSFPKLVKALGGDVWCPLYSDVKQEEVTLAHDLGLKVTVWSVDEPTEMLKMINMGVDGIITNRPDILKNLIHVGNLAAYK